MLARVQVRSVPVRAKLGLRKSQPPAEGAPGPLSVWRWGWGVRGALGTRSSPALTTALDVPAIPAERGGSALAAPWSAGARRAAAPSAARVR